MQNSLLVVLRQINHLSPAAVAQKLNVDLDIYKKMEGGDLLMHRSLAREIGRLYKTNAGLIYTSARQVDSLLAQSRLIRTLEMELAEFRRANNLKDIYEMAKKVFNETDTLLVSVNDMMQNWNNGSAKMAEHINDNIERSNKIIRQNDLVYEVVDRKIKQTDEAFKITYENCQQAIKDVSAKNDELSKENEELKSRLGG